MPDERVRRLEQERLELPSALALAQARGGEVVAVVASCSSDDEARTALTALLDLTSPVQADAVMDMQVRRFTTQNVDRIRLEIDERLAGRDSRAED